LHIEGGAIPARRDVLTSGREARRVGVAMTNYADGLAGSVVMLAQTGSPSRAVRGRDRVGIFRPAVTPHTGNGVDTVLGGAGAAEVYRIARYSSAVVTVATVAANIHIIQVDLVEMACPDMAPLSLRRIGALAEGAVALGALPLVVRIIRVELVRRGVAGPEGYRQGGQRPDRESTATRN
jgi:hypothetical protein